MNETCLVLEEGNFKLQPQRCLFWSISILSSVGVYRRGFKSPISHTSLGKNHLPNLGFATIFRCLEKVGWLGFGDMKGTFQVLGFA